MFGLSPSRSALALLAIAVLVAANWWQYGRQVSPTPSRSVAAQPHLPVLVSINLTRELAAPEPGSIRDIFRPDDAEAAVEPTPALAPEPTQAPSPPPPPDPRKQAIEAAGAEIEKFTIVGLLGAGEAMIAVLKNGSNVSNISVGDELLPGLVVSRIAFDRVTIFSDNLQHEWEIRIDGGQ